MIAQVNIIRLLTALLHQITHVYVGLQLVRLTSQLAPANYYYHYCCTRAVLSN